MRLLEPLSLGPRGAANRVVFGPHETNLARGRSVSERHVAYYAARAAGGAGTIVVEEASVHHSDWPYERSPLASASLEGWRAVADACHPFETLVIAALGHAGGQGSSAYSQAPLWAPSRVPEVNSREVPKWMEPADIAAVIEGFEVAARGATQAGLDGVEVNAGQYSLVRQFLSGLTNQRDDEWGADRLRFARDVLAAVRRGAGPEAVVGLRLSCDELAPWAGIVPEHAATIAAELASAVDYITVVRGSIFTVSATRPDGHAPSGFNIELARHIRAAVSVPVIVQGSIVDVDQAEAAIADGAADGAEMTRAQIADSHLVAKLRAGHVGRIRPCILCNQRCQVRDPRNPIVSCVAEPAAGYETTELAETDGDMKTTRRNRRLLVVGAGPAGLEAARVAAHQGFDVTVAFADTHPGGMVRVAAKGAGRESLAGIVDWLDAECRHAGVDFQPGRTVTAADIDGFDGDVILCTGSAPGRPTYEADAGAPLLTAPDALLRPPATGPVVVWDPIGGPIGVSVAELLRGNGLDVHLVTPDLIAGNELARTGDLAPANVRLLGSGVVIEKRSILRHIGATRVTLEDRFTGERRTLAATTVVDAGHRLPDDALWRETGRPRAGDAVAPRTIYEAILEGRRRALELASASSGSGSGASAGAVLV